MPGRSIYIAAVQREPAGGLQRRRLHAEHVPARRQRPGPAAAGAQYGPSVRQFGQHQLVALLFESTTFGAVAGGGGLAGERQGERGRMVVTEVLSRGGHLQERVVQRPRRREVSQIQPRGRRVSTQDH